MSESQENPLQMIIITAVFGVVAGLLVLFLATQRDAREQDMYYNYDPYPVLVEATSTTLPPVTASTVPLGGQVLDAVGSTAGDVWAGVTSPDAKETYGNVGRGVSDGWGRVSDSFNQSVDQQRQAQQAP